MTALLEIKGKLKSIYAEYAYAITMVLKFVLALIVFLSINRTIGFWEPLQNVFLILIFSLLCSLLSTKAAAIFAGILIMGHSYALGLEVLGITVVLFLCLFLFFLRFDEKDGLALLLMPLAISVGIPVFIPICYGLKRKPASAVSVVSGTVVYYYIHMLSEKASVLQNADRSDLFNSILTNLRILVDGFLKNQLMILMLTALALTLCVVYVVRRLPLDYIWHIAIGSGAVHYLIIMISGGLFLDIEVSAGSVVLGTLVAVLMALVMEFLVLNVDYSRTERMEFEDDEYYYYVKAVPKLTISKPQREIKTISSAPDVPESVNVEIAAEETGESDENCEEQKKESKRTGLRIKTKTKQSLLKIKDFTKKKTGQTWKWLKQRVQSLKKFTENLLTKERK